MTKDEAREATFEFFRTPWETEDKAREHEEWCLTAMSAHELASIAMMDVDEHPALVEAFQELKDIYFDKGHKARKPSDHETEA